MKEILRQIIIDFQDFKLPQLVRRDFSLPGFPEHVRKAFIFTGMRRSGKTWSLYQVMEDLLKRKIDRNKILYVNFEDERLRPFGSPDFDHLLNTYFELFPQNAQAHDVHFFFDEIHEIDGWEKFVRRLLDTEKAKIYLTGSSAKMLSREIATALRGRTFTIEIFPFSFEEFLVKNEVDFKLPLSSKKRALLLHHFREYAKFGGFPESIGLDKSLHVPLLQSYCDSVIYRDIVDRYLIRNIIPLKELIRFTLRNVSSSVSINKLYQSFKLRGIEVGKNSLYEFYAYLEDAYFTFLVHQFSYSDRKQAINPKKIYAIDPGMITAFSIKPEFDFSAALENIVFLALRRKKVRIFYYTTTKKREVDFLVIHENDEKELLQVSVSIKDPSTRDREVRALKEAMDETGMSHGTIITLEEEETIASPPHSIRVVSVIEWLLKNKRITIAQE